jgi:CheY-like chemotaxis protein
MARILVIDDQPLIRDLFREALEHDGHHVTVAADGDEGVRSCHDAHSALVVVDRQMPGLDGFETIRPLRTMGDVPIIAMSGGGESVGPRREPPRDRAPPRRRAHRPEAHQAERLSHAGA